MNDLSETLVGLFRVEPEGRVSTITDALLSRPVYLIGSDARCQLQLADALPVHAVVERKGDDYFIQPRYPNAEVRLNRKPVRGPMPLHLGDQVQIGSHTLVYGQERRALPNTAPRAAATPSVSLAPARVRSAPIPPPRPATAPVIAAAGTQVYFPRSAEMQQGANLAALALGAVTLLLIVAVVGFGLVNSTSANMQAIAAVNPFAYNDGNITMVMFEAEWCQYCKQQKPIVHGLEREYKGDLYVVYVDIDERSNRALVAEYNASSIPLMVILNDAGEVSSILRGLTPASALRAAFDRALQESATN